MYKMRTSRKRPNRKNHAIPRLFPESPPAQAWGWMRSGGHCGGLASPAGEQGAVLPLLLHFPAACLTGFSLCDEGILNIIGKNFCMTGLCSVFEGGEPHYFVLGPCESSWPGRIVRAKGCEGASSANPPCIALWEMVRVSRFLWLSAPLKTLFSWGTVVMLPSQVQLGLQADHSTQGRTSV